jgi:phage host-nuclease inhibitor protein Gam
VNRQRRLHSDCDAEWLLRKLANNAADKVRVTAQAQDIITALEADSADLMFKYGAALAHYCREKLAAEGNRRKSVRFLQGTCAFRYNAPAVKIKDPGAALSWAKENAPALVAVESVERLDADGFRDAAERIRAKVGELLPGVEYSEAGDSFSLSFPKEVKPKRKG